jgi:hypothetical protein
MENKKIEPEAPIDGLNMPEELAESLRLITGERPTSFQKEFVPNTAIYPKFTGAAFEGESAQQEFLKKKDPVEKRVRYKDNEIHILDLTDAKQRLEYTALVDTIGDPESGVILAEDLKDPQILLDTNAPLGYRAIVVIKTTKPEIYLKKKGPGYEVQEKKRRQTKEDVDG